MLFIALTACAIFSATHTQTALASDFTPSAQTALTKCKPLAYNSTVENSVTTPTSVIYNQLSSITQTQKVYRMYNYITSEHLWTTSASEYEELPAHNWNQENVGWV